MSNNNFLPLEKFLTEDINPTELVQYLDAVYHECAMSKLRTNDADADTIDGLHYIRELKKTLEKCHE